MVVGRTHRVRCSAVIFVSVNSIVLFMPPKLGAAGERRDVGGPPVPVRRTRGFPRREGVRGAEDFEARGAGRGEMIFFPVEDRVHEGKKKKPRHPTTKTKRNTKSWGKKNVFSSILLCKSVFFSLVRHY